jgi:quercetin dioxygenase-like cupin family protein
MAHAVVDAANIEALNNGIFKPLRQALGVSAFGVNQLELPPNVEGPEHDHAVDGQEEVYAVVRGSGTVRVEGEELELAPGRFVYLSPDAKRQMVAGPDGLAWIGIGCQPGAYRPPQAG